MIYVLWNLNYIYNYTNLQQFIYLSFYASVK